MEIQELTQDEIISLIRSGELKKNWSDYKDQWRKIQDKLKRGRICPKCGSIYANMFRSHLEKEGMTAEDWYCLYYNIPKVQHYCKHCNKPVQFYERSFYYPDYCSKSCTGHVRGVMCGGAGARVGGYNYVSKELAAEYGWSEEKRLFHNARVHEIKSQGWHGSKAEPLLGVLLDKLGIKYIKQYVVPDTKYRADYYLPDYNLILECDGAFKWNNRKLDQYYIDRAVEITKKTGILVNNIYQFDIYYYEDHLDELKTLIINRDTTSKLITYRKN